VGIRRADVGQLLFYFDFLSALMISHGTMMGLSQSQMGSVIWEMIIHLLSAASLIVPVKITLLF